MKQEICSECKKRTFVDLDFGDKFIDGQFYCSDCVMRLKDCVVCGIRFFNGKSTATRCNSCQLIFNRKYITPWHAVRYNTLLRDRFTCRYCGASPIKDVSVTLHCDHILPRSKGGSDSITNLVTTCFECNSGKSDATMSDESMKIVRERIIYDREEDIEKTCDLIGKSKFKKLEINDDSDG